jgi:peroxiredoxin
VIAPATASSMPAVGLAAPDFTLPSTSGGEITLSKLRGKKVLLAFFPLEMCSFSDDLQAFRETGTEVLPISVDSIPTLKEFKAKERIAVDLLSDFKREVSRRYGTLLEDRFHSNRSYILIDRDGVVRWTFAEDSTSQRRENAELLERIRTL